MAWYKIHHACDHTCESQLYGREIEREKEIDRQTKLDCPACAKAKWIEQHKGDPPTAVVRKIPPRRPNSRIADVEIIVVRSFSIRDELKARGYRFGEFALNPDLFAGMQFAMRSRPYAVEEFRRVSKLTKGWAIILEASAETEDDLAELVERFKVEIFFLGKLGCQIEEKIKTDPFQLAGSSFMEGRPDLI